MSKRKPQYTPNFFGFTKTVKHRGNEVPVHISDVIEEEEIAKRIQYSTYTDNVIFC